MERTRRVSGQMTLSECGCGRLHLTYGPITLHFEREDLVRFAGEVGRLTAHLRHRVADREPVFIPGQKDTVCH